MKTATAVIASIATRPSQTSPPPFARQLNWLCICTPFTAIEAAASSPVVRRTTPPYWSARTIAWRHSASVPMRPCQR